MKKMNAEQIREKACRIIVQNIKKEEERTFLLYWFENSHNIKNKYITKIQTMFIDLLSCSMMAFHIEDKNDKFSQDFEIQNVKCVITEDINEKEKEVEKLYFLLDKKTKK